MRQSRRIKLPYPKDADGKHLCRWCGGAITDKRRRFWCGEVCVEQYRLQYDPAHQRQLVAERDHGVCAICTVDTERLRDRAFPESPQGVGHYSWSRRISHTGQEHALRQAERDLLRLYRFIERIRDTAGCFLDHPWLIKCDPHGHLWEMDHTIPLSEGGTGLLDNLRTLCLGCHKQETKLLAGRLARRPKKKGGGYE